MINQWGEDERGELLRRLEWIKIYKLIGERGIDMEPSQVNDDYGWEDIMAEILEEVFGDYYSTEYGWEENIETYGLELSADPDEIQTIIHVLKTPGIIDFINNLDNYDKETLGIFESYLDDFMPDIKYYSSGYELAQFHIAENKSCIVFYSCEIDFFSYEFLEKLLDFTDWCEERSKNYFKYYKKGCEKRGLVDKQHNNPIYGEQNNQSIKQ